MASCSLFYTEINVSSESDVKDEFKNITFNDNVVLVKVNYNSYYSVFYLYDGTNLTRVSPFTCISPLQYDKITGTYSIDTMKTEVKNAGDSKLDSLWNIVGDHTKMFDGVTNGNDLYVKLSNVSKYTFQYKNDWEDSDIIVKEITVDNNTTKRVRLINVS